MTSEMQHLVLFWIFIAFFLLIGLVAILAIVGVIKTEQQFRNWAVGGFAASVVGVVIIWAKSQPPLDIFVNLEPPSSVAIQDFELVSGHTNTMSNQTRIPPPSNSQLGNNWAGGPQNFRIQV